MTKRTIRHGLSVFMVGMTCACPMYVPRLRLCVRSFTIFCALPKNRPPDGFCPPCGGHGRCHTPLSPFGLQNEIRTIQKGLSVFHGGDNGARTRDLLTASQALSQLSYTPMRFCLLKYNTAKPRRCQALTESFFKYCARRPSFRAYARRERAIIMPCGLRQTGR